jgi:hypothetical protein
VVWRETPHSVLGPDARERVGGGARDCAEIERPTERFYFERGVVFKLLLEIDVALHAVKSELAGKRVPRHDQRALVAQLAPLPV